MKLENEKLRDDYKKFIFFLYKDFFTYLETQYLKKSLQSCTPNELINILGGIRDYNIVALNNYTDVLRVYVVETLKECDTPTIEAFINTRMSDDTLFSGSRGEPKIFLENLHAGKFDNEFFKTVFEIVGPDFSTLESQEKASVVCRQAQNQMLMTLFEQYPIKAFHFMSHLIPLEYRHINLTKINFTPLFILATSSLSKFMSEPQKALARLGRRLNHLELEFTFTAERDEFLLVMFHLQVTKIKNLRQASLHLPNAFKDPRSEDMLGTPYIISTGYTFNHDLLINHLKLCYQSQELPNCPFTYKPLSNAVALPEKILRVKNILLADIIHHLLSIIEMRQIYQLPPINDQEFVDLVGPFISTVESEQFYHDPVIALSGELAGQTFERSVLLGKLRDKYPLISHQALIDQFTIVPNRAIKDLIDHVNELLVELAQRTKNAL